MEDKASHERLRRRVWRIVEFLPGHGWAASPQGHNVYLSESLRKLVEYSDLTSPPEDPDQYRWRVNVRPEQYDYVAARWKRSVETGENYDIDHEVLCGDGRYRWMRSSAKPVRSRQGKIMYWLGVVVDIDDAVRTAEKAQLNEKRLKTLLDTIPAPIWSSDEAGRPLYSNREHIAQTGAVIEPQSADEVDPLAHGISFMVHRDDFPAVERSVRRSFETGSPINVKYRKLLRDGSFRWVNNKAQALKDENGNVIRWYGVSFDIDDEVRLQHDLRERELELHRVVDTLPALVWTADCAGRPTYFNQRLKNWTGAETGDFESGKDAALLLSSRLLIHPDDQVETLTVIQAALGSGRPWTHRFRLRKTDGTYRWTEGRMEPLRNDDGAILHWYGLAVDIEDEISAKESLAIAQERLTRAMRIASMAELSAAIVHEVSQPLAGILAGSDAARRWLEADPPNIARAMASLERLSISANNASGIIQRIRSLFQRAEPQRSLASINAIVRKAIELAADDVSFDKVRITTALAPDLPEVPVDAVEIQQIVLNLLKNAAEAMENTPKSQRMTMVKTDLVNGRIIISVEDHGTGVEDFEGIFTPFVTTKPKGMGMGLSISRSIVATYGGRLWVENTAKGARFSFDINAAAP